MFGEDDLASGRSGVDTGVTNNNPAARVVEGGEAFLANERGSTSGVGAGHSWSGGLRAGAEAGTGDGVAGGREVGAVEPLVLLVLKEYTDSGSAACIRTVWLEHGDGVRTLELLVVLIILFFMTSPAKRRPTNREAPMVGRPNPLTTFEVASSILVPRHLGRTYPALRNYCGEQYLYRE